MFKDADLERGALTLDANKRTTPSLGRSTRASRERFATGGVLADDLGWRARQDSNLRSVD